MKTIPQTDRVPAEMDLEKLSQELHELQVPCPWGDLAEIKPERDFDPLISEIPLSLVVGSGITPIKEIYRAIARTRSFGKIILSDIYPTGYLEDYIKLDLTDPEQINLFGYKVHAIMSMMVFTEDGYGVVFKDQKNMRESAKGISNLLMPGGIFAKNPYFPYNHFENILIKEHGFRKVYDSEISVIWQKPF